MPCPLTVKGDALGGCAEWPGRPPCRWEVDAWGLDAWKETMTSELWSAPAWGTSYLIRDPLLEFMTV